VQPAGIRRLLCNHSPPALDTSKSFTQLHLFPASRYRLVREGPTTGSALNTLHPVDDVKLMRLLPYYQEERKQIRQLRMAEKRWFLGRDY